ncbi:peptidoglycan D,D-transpeptidase FtsI family protein [Nigerium massiliense]|uniref:peptidoglycan D,D-transpeptidase FtsI family protein n=1 Tax=Nigerium massiliense TaxID=1522317 RepID=UPI000694E4AF|nr:penicillin-binding protein 2 [Nigerium massiliense]
MSAQAPKKAVRAGRRWPLAASAGRIRVLLIVAAMLFSLCGARAIQVQVLDPGGIADEAAKQYLVTRPIEAERGTITDRNGQVMAFTEDTVNIVADPTMIATNGKEPETMRDEDRKRAQEAPAAIAAVVAKYTGRDAGDIEGRLRNTTVRYTILAPQVTASTYAAVNAELEKDGWVGVFKERNPRRNYPMGTVASNVLGFMSQGEGAGGLEFSLQKQLAGTPGKESYQNSPNGRVPLGAQTMTPAVDGEDVQLSIDSSLNWAVEQRLAQAVTENKANWGIAIVMDVKTGRLLALANSPSFNSNEPGKAKTPDLGNRAITNVYEPGSTMKVLTLSALLDAGLTNPDEVTDVPPSIKVGDNEVKDAFKHQDIQLTTRGILVRSSNIGTIELARRMDKATTADYLRRYGLGAKTGLGLPGEASGRIPSATMPDYTRDGIAFGTSLSVTSVQMAAAVAGVMNGGVYTAPTIIESTTGTDGKRVEAPLGQTHRVISDTASLQMREMMEQMVIHYKDKLSIPGYRTSAKTGTAWGIDPKTGKYKGLVTSIIGAVPTEDPQILTYVVLGKDDRAGAGLGTAGPVYKDIMSLAIPRYGIKPSANVVTTQLPLEKNAARPKKK